MYYNMETFVRLASSDMIHKHIVNACPLGSYCLPGQRPSGGEDFVPVHMVQRAEAVGAQERRALVSSFCVKMC